MVDGRLQVVRPAVDEPAHHDVPNLTDAAPCHLLVGVAGDERLDQRPDRAGLEHQHGLALQRAVEVELDADELVVAEASSPTSARLISVIFVMSTTASMPVSCASDSVACVAPSCGFG